jgi:hypothetical protein
MAVREWLTGRHSHHNRLVLVLENLRERKLVSRAVKWANLSENIAAGKGCGYAPVLHQLHVGKCISGFDGEDGRAVERALADGRAQERGDGNAVQHGHGGVCRMSRGCELTYGTVKAELPTPAESACSLCNVLAPDVMAKYFCRPFVAQKSQP